MAHSEFPRSNDSNTYIHGGMDRDEDIAVMATTIVIATTTKTNTVMPRTFDLSARAFAHSNTQPFQMKSFKTKLPKDFRKYSFLIQND